jgi:hypothetical protein
MIDGNLFILNDPDIVIEILIFATSSLPKFKIKGIADYKKIEHYLNICTKYKITKKYILNN